MKKIKKALKTWFADTGLLGGIVFGIAMFFFCLISWPFFLIEFLNDKTKKWFGGENDETN